ncbi:hypothetical protein RN001_005426 [Aquatica leii]|uniref:Uncharacterized protein n=1 Tax=Aquatica leii TaxID=1421715 RepID=A0AAN7SHV3_9COLE|nr:hypothetical protein RN001_005426 [Aquatica leii]
MKSLTDPFENKHLKVWQVLLHVTNVKICLDDRFPSQVCSECMRLLQAFYDFKLKFEKNQQILSSYFKEELVENDSFISVLELVQENSEVVPVELISKQGKFDLKDVFIVEPSEEESFNFNGFLNNLGTEVSASFVNSNCSFDNVSDQNSLIISDIRPESNNDKSDSNGIDDESERDLCNSPIRKENASTKIVKSNNDPVTCFICDKRFAKKAHLKQHIETRHSNKKQTIFVCEVCGVIIKSRSSHYHHMLKHAGKKYVCNFCQKSYSNSSALQLHIAAVHKNMRTHLCTICGKLFNYSNALTYHMRIHTDERKYKCTYCDKTFRIQCGLDRHLRTHTGIRPYKCSYCDKAFRSKGEVDCHEMTHTGYRPYHCEYCKKGFTKTYNLKLHLLSHKGQHYCTKCERTFIELEFLNIHMKSSHSNCGIIEEDNDT